MRVSSPGHKSSPCPSAKSEEYYSNASGGAFAFGISSETCPNKVTHCHSIAALDQQKCRKLCPLIPSDYNKYENKIGRVKIFLQSDQPIDQL